MAWHPYPYPYPPEAVFSKMIVLSFVCCIPLPRPRRRGVTATSSHTSVRIKNGNKYLSPEVFAKSGTCIFNPPFFLNFYSGLTKKIPLFSFFKVHLSPAASFNVSKLRFCQKWDETFFLLAKLTSYATSKFNVCKGLKSNLKTSFNIRGGPLTFFTLFQFSVLLEGKQIFPDYNSKVFRCRFSEPLH